LIRSDSIQYARVIIQIAKQNLVLNAGQKIRNIHFQIIFSVLIGKMIYSKFSRKRSKEFSSVFE